MIVDKYIKFFKSDINPDEILEKFWVTERKIEAQEETISYLK